MFFNASYICLKDYMSLFKVLEAIKLIFGQGVSKGIPVMLIDMYSIISLNAFCDLSYTRNILPRESAGTASKKLLLAFCSNLSFAPLLFPDSWYWNNLSSLGWKIQWHAADGVQCCSWGLEAKSVLQIWDLRPSPCPWWKPAVIAIKPVQWAVATPESEG